MFAFTSSRGRSSFSLLLKLLPVALVPLSGCASGSAHLSGPSAFAPYSSARITVDNQYRADINVYIVANGARYKLGQVESFRSRTFSIPRVIQLPSEVDLLISSLATGERFESESITLMPADEITCSFENTARLSYVLRR